MRVLHRSDKQVKSQSSPSAAYRRYCVSVGHKSKVKSINFVSAAIGNFEFEVFYSAFPVNKVSHLEIDELPRVGVRGYTRGYL